MLHLFFPTHKPLCKSLNPGIVNKHLNNVIVGQPGMQYIVEKISYVSIWNLDLFSLNSEITNWNMELAAIYVVLYNTSTTSGA